MIAKIVVTGSICMVLMYSPDHQALNFPQKKSHFMLRIT